ncbi:hypothetical protein DH2020_012430 [Rehmannia glutinosa]|uniref:Formin-like protein n=1 Tax=Rehmannia glutinosa TaxID=99300 RepID=A0ABR0X1U8_REHGL
MRAHYITIFFFITSLITTSFSFQFTHSYGDEKNRRILHQPLFPAISSPPPPPPPETPDFPDEDHPFSNELPTGPPTVPDQSQQQPPPLPAIGTAVVANPVATQPPSKPAKKLAIAISSAILTLGMLSVMAFYLYKNRRRHSDDTQKLFDESSQRINEESRMPPPTLIRTATETAPPTGSFVYETNTAASSSPYQKLNFAKKFDRYRPSPELQPLPPLTKPPPPAGLLYSPPPMSSSSDDESQVNPARPENQVTNSIPHSKRTSPKSRFSPSPSINQSPTPLSPTISLGPPQPSKTLKYSPKRAKFSPPPNTERRRSISNNDQNIPKIQVPHPPPPPPPPPSIPRNHGAVKTITNLPVSRQIIRPHSNSPSPKATPAAEKRSPVEDVHKFDVEDEDGLRPKMKPLHWDKVRATSERATVWDNLKSSSFQLNEDAMESLFGRNSAQSVPRHATRKLVFPSYEKENRVLDPKKSQNIAILLRALNVTREEVCEALLDGNPEGLGPELFETLVKMAPSKEEEIKLKEYNIDEISKLGPAERFLRAILDIPFAFKRVEAMLYRANFNTEVEYLRKSFKTLEQASEELKNSRLFLKLLEAVLRTGNRMNDGTNRGSAKAFKLDTLLKLVDIKGTDGKTTLLHFVVQEIIRSEGANSNPTNNFKFNEDDDFKKQGLQIVAGLSKELGNVKKAATMDSDVLSSYVSKLESGLQKVRQVLQYENESMHCKFFDSMRVFLKEAVDEISRVKAEERKALSLVKEVTQYFHGDAAKQEAHPLRIFMVIRDFLSVLDNVCKDVGRMQDRTTVGAGRSFRISANASLPVLDRYNSLRNDRSSDDDSMLSDVGYSWEQNNLLSDLVVIDCILPIQGMQLKI